MKKRDVWAVLENSRDAADNENREKKKPKRMKPENYIRIRGPMSIT